MAIKWSLEKLKALSVHDRGVLYKNACAKADNPEAAELKAMIESVGLPYSEEGSVTMDDPLTLRMQEIIYSEAGKAAAVKGAKEGMPALTYIDPMLQAALGVDYGAHNQTTHTAGLLVAQLMTSLGYRKDRSKPLPSNCVAKTAAMWK